MRSLALLIFSTILLAAVGTAGVIQPELEAALNASAPNEQIHVMIVMQEQGDSDWMMQNTADLDRRAAREFAVNYLSEIADRTQAEVKNYLASRQAAGQVRNLQSVFIVNMLHCYATPEVIRGLEKFSGIAEVAADPESYALLGAPSNSGGPVQVDGTDEIAWGVADVNAPAVWAMGYNGTGVLVGMIDCGVNYNHVDLADHMWNGGPQYPNHGYDFYYNDNNPIDDNGHGTHTAGTVGSDGTAGSQCGVAPNATIMAIKVLSSGGNGSPAQCISGINFAVAQGCDIFSMSLGWVYSVINATEKAQFRTACVNALAAGVIGAVAAGNEGQYGGGYAVPNNVRTPGTCPPPWLHPAQTLTGGLSCVVTCGATQSNHQIAAFSSHGPVTWSSISPYLDYPYNPGMGLMDPDVSAPGVEVKSCAWNNNTGYLQAGWSGTSMATPHVAGTLALMLNKNPNMTPRQLDSLLEITSLDLGNPGKDNTYGAGLINAAAAVSATPGGAPPSMTLDIIPSGSTIIPPGGGTLSYTANLTNNSSFPVYFQYWATFSQGSTVVAAFGPASRLASAGPGYLMSRSLTQTVAGSLAAGSWNYNVYVGQYPGTVWTTDSFPFTKSAVGNGGTYYSENTLTGWDDEPAALSSTPAKYELMSASPNPFNPTTTLSFVLPQAGQVKLSVFNVAGREVATLVNGYRAAGSHEVTFDASGLASGLYIYRLTSGSFDATGKMMLLK